jgi:hypothetical protein
MQKRKVSVYQYKGDTYQQDDFDDDYGNEGNGRNRQVSYYVNKDVGRQLDDEEDDDDYGQQVNRGYGGKTNMANHRDTYRNRGNSDY